MLIRAYNAAHDFATTNIFNSPGSQKAGVLAAGAIIGGSIACEIKAAVASNGVRALAQGVTTCFHAAKGTAFEAAGPNATTVLTTISRAACSDAVTSAVLPVISALVVVGVPLFCGYKAIQYMKSVADTTKEKTV